jgi:UDP-N-acetylmuramoylalanine--D-glutamate ligase
MYESGKRIFKLLMEREFIDSNIVYCNDLYSATTEAEKLTQSGSACILSPASASYGEFRNFEERGNVFKSIIFGN